MEIKTKREYLELSRAGKLGNTLRTWWSYEDLINSKFQGHVTIRCYIRDSNMFVPDILVKDVATKLTEYMYAGALLSQFYFQEIPHLKGCENKDCQGCGRILNAEVSWIEPHHMVLRYGTNPSLSLRRDLDQNGIEVYDLTALETLRYFIKDSGIDYIQNIMDNYPDCVMEFSCFGYSVGVEKYPIVVWEVRQY